MIMYLYIPIYMYVLTYIIYTYIYRVFNILYPKWEYTHEGFCPTSPNPCPCPPPLSAPALSVAALAWGGVWWGGVGVKSL